MKILFIGKYPPIQGGVSILSYKLAHARAHQGHTVHVLTNAEEVPLNFKQFFYGEDCAHLNNSDVKDNIHIHPILKNNKDTVHIPNSPAYETRIFGAACQIIKEHDIDMIHAYYFQPYGFVAALLKEVFNIPLVLMHAGSDLGRIAKHEDYRSAYTYMVNKADVIITSDHGEPRNELLNLGATEDQLGHYSNLPAYPIPNYFKEATPLDLNNLSVELGEHYMQYAPLSQDLRNNLVQINAKNHNNSIPTIGIYGKVGVEKGTYTLLTALSNMAKEGIKFQFACLASGDKSELEIFYSTIINDEALANCSFIFPPLAHWRVAQFIKTCYIVCALENGFDIGYHSPGVPKEIMAGGSCLVCSAEIEKNPLTSRQIVNNETCVTINDLRSHKELQDTLSKLLESKELVEDISKRAFTNIHSNTHTETAHVNYNIHQSTTSTGDEGIEER